MLFVVFVFFFKQKTAYEMRISDWSSDVCSSDLRGVGRMTPFLPAMIVVARRDFLAMVATPTFFLFLLAPLFMVGMGPVGGVGASQIADSASGAGRIVAIAAPDRMTPRLKSSHYCGTAMLYSHLKITKEQHN